MAAEDPGRRKVLTVLVGVGSCALGAAIVGPAVVFVAGPASGGSGGADAKARWVKVARLSQLPEGTPVKLSVVADQRDAFSVAKNVDLGAIWVRKTAGKIQALSCVCPHLGCAVHAEGEGYLCPCHTSRFDGNGKKESGPSPRDLDSLETKIDGDDLLVDFRKFRVGAAEREIIG
jgi:menaquinol-cytochrome c reductase iron-sulfur subunit